MRARDQADFAGFVRDASPGLLTSAWVLTGDARVAEDLVLEALGRVYPRWREVRQGRPVATASDELLSLYAARLAPATAPPEQAAEVGDGPGPHVRDDDLGDPLAPGPSLAGALDRLPRRQRAAVGLRCYLAHPGPQSARLLGVTEDELGTETAAGLAALRELLAEPASPERPSEDEVRAMVARAGADAPPMHLPTDAALSSGRQRVRRTRARVAAGVVAAAVAVTAWAGFAGSRDDDTVDQPLPVTVPTWDTTRGFEVRIGPRLGDVSDRSTLAVNREAGAERFSVVHEDEEGRLELEPVEGPLPGQAELLRGPDFSVVLTPVPPALQEQWALLVWGPRGSGWGSTRVAADDGQGLLVNVIGQDTGPVEPEQVLDVVWVARGTVVAASGDPVPQATLGYGTEAKVFTLPEHDLLGLVRREFSSPTSLGTAETGRWVMFGVGAAGGDPAADEQPRMLLILLPPDATEASLRLDDGVGTQRPLETVPLGDHLAAWTILRQVDPAYDVAGSHPAVTWAGSDGETRSLADEAADLVLELGDETYWFGAAGKSLRVSGGGVTDTLPLRPAGGVAHLRTMTRDLAVLTGPRPPGDPVIVTDQPAPGPLSVVTQQPMTNGTLAEDGQRLTLVQLPESDFGAHRALVSLGMTRDGQSCALRAPEGVDSVTHVLEGAGLRGTLLHLPGERAVAVCFGELTVGGRLTVRNGEAQVVGETHQVLVRFIGTRRRPPDPDSSWSEVATVTVTDDVAVAVYVRPS